MTGGGSIFRASDGQRVTHGFELHCDPTHLPYRLEINWGGNRFHMLDLETAVCSFDPAVGDPAPPVADFNTYVGTGSGRYNGVPGATITFTLTDHSEPGVLDFATYTIRDVHGTIVLQASGYITKGNQQAH
jgi:hypothetical protein